MDALELIRTANSATEVLAALSVYVVSLRHVRAIPESCRRLPLTGERDVTARTMELINVVNLTSQHLRYRECNLAKQALRVFAAATWNLRRAGRLHGNISSGRVYK